MVETTIINIPVEDGGIYGDAMLEISVRCMECSHWEGNIICKAFPDGIPEEILNGKHDHAEPHKEDGGIQFESILNISPRMKLFPGTTP